MKFEIRVKLHNEEVAKVEGFVQVNPKTLTYEEMQRIPEIEALLERLTGYRFHIQELY